MRLRGRRASPIRTPSNLNRTASRGLAFLTWICSTFALVSVILINLGGVSIGQESISRPRISNSGLELLSWYLSGNGDTSITNYYHYRLYLHRQCSVNRQSTRGEGTCIIPHGIVGSFYISQGDPDEFVARENPFNPVVGKVDFTPAFVCYIIAAVSLAVLVMALPQIFLAPEMSRRHNNVRWLCDLYATISAVSLTIASATLTTSIIHLRLKMEFVPQVSHIFQGNTAISLSIVVTVCMILAAVANLITSRLNRNPMDQALPTKMLEP